MSTTTTTVKKKSSATDELREIEAREQSAASALREFELRQRASQERAHSAEAEVIRLAEDPLGAEQFDADGRPLPGTDAAQLAELIEHASDYTVVLARCRAELDRLRLASLQHRRDHALELVYEQAPAAVVAVEGVRSALGLLGQALAGYVHVQDTVTELLGVIDGLDGSDLPSVDLTPLQAAVESPDLPLPLPRSLVALDGQSQPKLRTNDGAFMEGHMSPADGFDESWAAPTVDELLEAQR